MKGTILDLFDELIYFTSVFPHPNLTLIAPMVQIEEIRYPGQGRRRRRRKGNFVTEDRRILEFEEACFFRTVQDLHALMPRRLPKEFDTKQLAEGLDVDRHTARKIAYVMRKTGAAIETGKRGNAILCRLANKRESRKALKSKSPKKRPSLDFMQAHLERKEKKALKEAKAAAKSAVVKKTVRKKTRGSKIRK
jgi:hypothetical protein